MQTATATKPLTQLGQGQERILSYPCTRVFLYSAFLSQSKYAGLHRSKQSTSSLAYKPQSKQTNRVSDGPSDSQFVTRRALAGANQYQSQSRPTDGRYCLYIDTRLPPFHRFPSIPLQSVSQIASHKQATCNTYMNGFEDDGV